MQNSKSQNVRWSSTGPTFVYTAPNTFPNQIIYFQLLGGRAVFTECYTAMPLYVNIHLAGAQGQVLPNATGTAVTSTIIGTLQLIFVSSGSDATAGKTYIYQVLPKDYAYAMGPNHNFEITLSTQSGVAITQPLSQLVTLSARIYHIPTDIF